MRISNHLFNEEAIYDEDNMKIIIKDNPFREQNELSYEDWDKLERCYDSFAKEISKEEIQKVLLTSYFGNIHTINIDEIR